MTDEKRDQRAEPAIEASAREPTRPTPAARVVGALPMVLVLAALAGVALWGHYTGWKAPRFSQLTGAAAKEKEDWCEEHGVPESRCIKCHPELVGASANDWCREHGVAESKCTICHPEILKTGVAGDWCPEHGLPESSCTLCHPEIAVKGSVPVSDTAARVTLDPAATRPATLPSSASTDDKHDHAHDGHDHGQKSSSPTTSSATGHEGHDHSAAGHSHQKEPKTCQTHALRVQFASIEAVRKVGIKLGQVVDRPMATSIAANAEVQYDRTKLAQVSSPLPGKVWRVEKEVGQPVQQGEVIALVEAAEVGRLKAEFLQAIADLDLRNKTVKRLRTSAESGFRTGAELEEAEAAVRSANIKLFNAQQALINLGLSNRIEDLAQLPERKNLQFMGLPKSLADSLDPKTTTANLLPLVAPLAGIVIERNVVAGEVVEPSKPLLTIADTSQMWLTAELPLGDARRISIGQSVALRPDDAPDDGVTGKVSWISTAVDDQTRTVRVRANVDNPEGRLLAHTFGRAFITIREKPGVTAVPNEAIQWEGCCHIVFVRLTGDIFQTRKVKLGSKANGFTEIINGVLPGEVVVTQGSHVLKSEILKSALGAGCADGH